MVSIAPSLTETVIALGAADRLVGVSRYADFEEVKETRRVGGYLDPHVETIVALRPDLLLAEMSPGNQSAVKHLARLGIPVRVVRARTIDEVHEMLRTIARDLGLSEKGAALSKALSDELQAVGEEAAAKTPRRTLLVYGHHPLVVAGPGSFGDELLRIAGGSNVVEKAATPYPVIPLERLVGLDPDVIIDVVMGPGPDARTSPFETLGSLRAVREGRVVRLTDPSLMRPGPSLATGVRLLFEAIHPPKAEE